MLTYETRLILRRLLLEIAAHEAQLEILRQILCEQPAFESYAAFRRIDRNRRTYLAAYDLVEFLADNGFQYSEEDCQLFIKHYDRDDDQRLQYSEFLPALLPMENPDLRTIATQRKVYDVEPNQFLPYDVEYALARLIAREIEYYVDTEPARKELAAQPDFSPYDVFATIDIYETGNIDFTNLRNFFKSSGDPVEEDEVVAILRRLDRNDDGKLGFEEFTLGTQPQNLSIKRPSLPRHLKTYDNKPKTVPTGNKENLKKTTSPIKMFVASSPVQTLAKKTSSKGMSTRESKEKFNSTADRYFAKALSEKNTTGFLTTKAKTKPGAGDVCHELVKILREIITLEIYVEQAKQNLAMRKDFNFFDAFRMFDLKGKGNITVGEIEATFAELGIKATKQNIYLLVKRFDVDGDGYWKFTEFLNAVAAFKSEYQKLVQSRPPLNSESQYIPTQVFSQETKTLLKDLFVLHIENETIIEALRQKLQKNKSYNLKDLFSFLDSDKDGQITLYDLRVAFDRYDIFATEKDLYFLINRFDINDDRALSYPEFVAALNPKSHKKIN